MGATERGAAVDEGERLGNLRRGDMRERRLLLVRDDAMLEYIDGFGVDHVDGVIGLLERLAHLGRECA